MIPGSLPDYDSWLEAPYQRAQAEGDAFNDFCEQFELDPSDPTAPAAFERYMEDWAEERGMT